MIYLLLPFFSLIAATIRILNFKGGKNIYYVLVAITVLAYFVIVGLRGEGIGTDYFQYEGFFHEPQYTEPGFGFFIRFTKLFFNNYHFFLSIVCLVGLLARLWLFKRTSNELAISLMIMFGFWMLVYDMNGIRQGLSLSFIGMAGYFAYRRKIFLYVIFTAIATSIHYSSFMFFIFYFFLIKNINKKNMIFTVVILYLLAVLNISGYIFSLLMESSLKGVFVEKVNAYSKMDAYNANTLFSFNTFHRIFIFLVVLFSIEKIPANENMKKFLLTASFLNICVFLLMSRFELIAVRGSLPFRFFEMVFFSYLPFVAKNKHTQFWITFLLFLYVCFQTITVINVKDDVDNTLMPYKNILF